MDQKLLSEAHAREVLLEALRSGTLKLLGPGTSSKEHAARAAEADAAYLLTLMHSLTQPAAA